MLIKVLRKLFPDRKILFKSWEAIYLVLTNVTTLGPTYRVIHIVKLHSDLRILTQLQLVGVGVDFVFPLEEEGRRRKKKKKNNPHLAFSRRKDPTCLIFSGCLVGVWRVSGNCLESV